MTIRVEPVKKRLPIIPDSVFFRFLAVSLILHGLFICVVSYNNENFRKKLMAQIRNAVPVKVIFYQQRDMPEIPSIRKEIPKKENRILQKTPEINLNKFAISGSLAAPAPGGKSGSPGMQGIMPHSSPENRVTFRKPAEKAPLQKHERSRRHSAKSPKKDADYIPLPGDISHYKPLESSTPEIKKTEKAEEDQRQTPPAIRNQKIRKAASYIKDREPAPQKKEMPSPFPIAPVKQVAAVSAVESAKAEPDKRDVIPMPSSDSGISSTLPSSSSETKDIPVYGRDEAPVSLGVSKPSKRVEETASSNRGNGAENHAAPAANPKPAENGGTGKNSGVKTESGGEEMRRRLAEFRGIVAGRIESVKVYPHEARQERQEGKVVISFIIDPTGNIGKVNIVSSSGFHLLDKAALEAAEAGAPYQPFPVGLSKPVRIKMTVNFKIS